MTFHTDKEQKENLKSKPKKFRLEKGLFFGSLIQAVAAKML